MHKFASFDQPQVNFLSSGLTSLFLVVGCCFPVGASEPKTESHPNVIVILSDDQGWGDLRLNGNGNLLTPNIDRIAKEGLQFERFFVCPVCSPTRAEFLTGRYHPRSGVYSTSAGGERMNLDEVTIADTFRAAGYATGAFGKWHNGMQYPYHPNGRGFDHYYGFCSGHWGNYFSPMLERNGQLVQGKGFCVDDFTNELLSFVEKNKEQPFFAYLPLNTPHSPMQVPDRFWEKFKDKELEFRHREPQKENIGHTRAALAMCENIDWNVGRILQRLDELKISERTIVIYFCDNGPNGARWNDGMKGRKGSTDEGGVRSPLLIRYPAAITPGTTVKQIGSVVDLLPTLADICGVKLIGKKTLDGVSLAPVMLKDKNTDPNSELAIKALRERMIVNHWRRKVSIRSQNYRLDHQGKLFDMQKDPQQRKDVAKDHPKIAAQMKKVANDFRDKVLPGYDQDERSFPVGHPDFKFTQIPARDGKTTGKIVRSNRFPNCSFFTNWKTTEDRITWDVEVVEDGEFDVTIYYTCPTKDVGAEFELGFGEQSLSGKIVEGHDPKLVGAQQDRVKRVESYVKPFKPLKMGTIKLEKGKGKLELRATRIPGEQVMDFRLLMLERKSG